jgi:hypothetical protein
VRREGQQRGVTAVAHRNVVPIAGDPAAGLDGSFGTAETGVRKEEEAPAVGATLSFPPHTIGTNVGMSLLKSGRKPPS